jgi:chemotaxis-related protein WspD
MENVDREDNMVMDNTQADLSVLVFRVAGQALALPATLVRRITEPAKPHAVPGRTDSRFLGIVNADKELTLCFSLADLLGITGDAAVVRDGQGRPRLIVVGEAGNRFAFTADEILGVRSVTVENSEPSIGEQSSKDGCEPLQVAVDEEVKAILLNEQMLRNALTRSLGDDNL